MKLIKASFLIKEQEKNIEGIYKQIEWAGRHCYKSEDKITSDSAKEFVERMIKSKHYAMLEHGTVYLTHPIENIGSSSYVGIGVKYRENKYSKVNYDTWGTRYITTNSRVLVENNWLDDLQYLCEPTEYHEKRTTVKFIMDRIGSQSFCRHRVFSFAQESTRYCNYTKDKFGNCITCILPIDNPYEDEFKDEFNINNIEYIKLRPAWQDWYNCLLMIESCYNNFVGGTYGISPQIARSILPTALKTELVMTGFDSDWEHFFELRTPATAHPQARELAIPLQKEMNKGGVIKSDTL